MAGGDRYGRQDQELCRLNLEKTRFMKVVTLPQSRIQNLKSKIHDYASLVRFSHTIFAMPFAMASLALAWRRHPVTLRALLWIIVAMVGARTAAMAFKRIADRKFDARNPRTQGWE